MNIWNKLIALTTAISIAVIFSGCSITVPVSATSNTVGSKVGKASGTGFLGVLNFGVDASIQSAAKNAGISKISTVDFQREDILGLIQTYTCIVTGE